MTRDEMLSVLFDMASNLVDNFSFETFRDVARYACDWNSTHDNETEIFVCDGHSGDGHYLGIEDDVFYY